MLQRSMRKSLKCSGDTFLSLSGRSLYIDKNGKSSIFTIKKSKLSDCVLDFSINDMFSTVNIITTDGNFISVNINNFKEVVVNNCGFKLVSASICNDKALIIASDTYKVLLMDFQCNVIEDYTENFARKRNDTKNQYIHNRFCILTPHLKAVADSSVLHIKREDEEDAGWVRHKFRDSFITSLINVNNTYEIGLTTQQNTRIFRKRSQTIFRSWAHDTISLLQCPCKHHYYAHLDKDGHLLVGDNESEFSIQEDSVTGICWDMGILWARDQDARWKKLLFSFNEQLFDLRVSRLSELEEPVPVKSKGHIIEVIETIIDRPAVSTEILNILPSIAQELKESYLIDDAIHSLETYVSKSEGILKLMGQIEMILPKSMIEPADE